MVEKTIEILDIESSIDINKAGISDDDIEQEGNAAGSPIAF